MVVDTSALVSMLTEETEAQTFARLLREAPEKRISAANYAELLIVMLRRTHENDPDLARDTIDRAGIEVIPVTAAQADLAAQAYRTYGKGRHRAALNFGDCFAYALAKQLDAPLLFKGTDFAETDIRAAAEG
jgi:ribonuclease VapC